MTDLTTYYVAIAERGYHVTAERFIIAEEGHVRFITDGELVAWFAHPLRIWPKGAEVREVRSGPPQHMTPYYAQEPQRR